MPPRDFAPTSQGDQLQWPKWGQHYETKGEAGEPPDLPEAKRLIDLYDEWITASEEREAEIWQRDAGDLCEPVLHDRLGLGGACSRSPPGRR